MKTTLGGDTAEVPTPPPVEGGPAKPVRPDTAALDIETLANLVLSREIKPRVGEIRRLAEALLRKKDRKRAKKARKADGKSVRKLSKIPARKTKK